MALSASVQMQVQVQKLSPVLVEFDVQVAADRVKSELDKAYANVAKSAVIVHESGEFGTGTAKLLQGKLPSIGIEAKELIAHDNPTRNFDNIALRNHMKSVEAAVRWYARQRGAEGPGGAGHLEGGASRTRGRRAGHAEPVGDHEALEAPLAPPDAAQQPWLLVAPPPVSPAVSGHDAERAALTHDDLERPQVDLAQGPLVDVRADRVALVLGVVADQVLDRRGHAFGLRTAHERGRQPAGQQRVLGVALEVAAGERRPVHVDGGCEQHAGALGHGVCHLLLDVDAALLQRQNRGDILVVARVHHLALVVFHGRSGGGEWQIAQPRSERPLRRGNASVPRRSRKSGRKRVRRLHVRQPGIAGWIRLGSGGGLIGGRFGRGSLRRRWRAAVRGDRYRCEASTD